MTEYTPERTVVPMQGQHWFLVSYAQGAGYIDELGAMLESFREFHPDVPVFTVTNPLGDQNEGWHCHTKFKATWCHQMAQLNAAVDHVYGDHMLWVDADARFRRRVEPPDRHYHVAAKCYGGRWATGTVWFNVGQPLMSGWITQRFLNVWVAANLRHAAQHDEDGFRAAVDDCSGIELFGLLDLPDTVSAPCSLGIQDYAGELETDAAIVHWNRSRRELGLVPGWPPDEEERRNALVKA